MQLRFWFGVHERQISRKNIFSRHDARFLHLHFGINLQNVGVLFSENPIALDLLLKYIYNPNIQRPKINLSIVAFSSPPVEFDSL